ncbi:MAG: ABC transporter ATP-binding protein [Nitrospirota bacterium]
MNILEIKDLKVHYKTSKGELKAVDGVSFELKKGESLGLVGESGCGKTSVAMAIMKLLPTNARIISGQILFKGEDLVPMTEKQMQNIRSKGIALIFQAAMNALNPVYRVENQIIEAICAHKSISKKEAKARVEELYHLVGLDYSFAKNYPHEYSGGMKQRAIIAMALSCNPEIIIADEPTTALDVIVQDQIIREIVEIQHKLEMSLIYISHDIGVIAETCNYVGVMYAGQIVEYAQTKSLFKTPLHPYTQGLLASYPSISGEKKKLFSIPAEPINSLSSEHSCRFYNRCLQGKDICSKEEPVYREVKDGHWVLCHLFS